MSVHEITQEQFAKVMGSNPSRFTKGYSIDSQKVGANHPVESVTWFSAKDFCNNLSALPVEKQAGHVYRLPTEAEWEYACRAGAKSDGFFNDADPQVLGRYAWFGGNYITHPVGQLKPNAWGLFDMQGNVWEWCEDIYGKDYYKRSPKTDPRGPSESGEDIERVLRGGSFKNDSKFCRSVFRNKTAPGEKSTDNASPIGFRVICDVPANVK